MPQTLVRGLPVSYSRGLVAEANRVYICKYRSVELGWLFDATCGVHISRCDDCRVEDLVRYKLFKKVWGMLSRLSFKNRSFLNK